MEKKSVLVIDDDQDVLDLVSAILETEGYEVELASTEDEVLERLTGGGQFDLIVTDVWMPWMSGLQVAHFAHLAGHMTPILFMSGFADPSLEERVRIFGEHTKLLRKPFEADTLLGAIDDLVYPEQKRQPRKASSARSASSRSGS